MNMLMKVLLDHREQREETGQEPCCEERCVKVKVAALSEVGMVESQMEDSLVMFVTCEQCNFLDFVTLI